MQPVQLSLIPEPSPAPPTPAEGAAQGLPADAVAAATALLAGVIVKAAALTGIEVTADE
jgi:hypothetical protein